VIGGKDAYRVEADSSHGGKSTPSADRPAADAIVPRQY